MAKQEDIRPIYHELQGYVSKAPSSDISLLVAAAISGVFTFINWSRLRKYGTF
ncbi:MAG: hypothetical protein WBC05_13525 [Sedimentisphaerales bacterium]